MRWFIALLVLSVPQFTLQPAHLAAQDEPPPELQALEYLVGDWVYSDGVPQSCEWFGTSFIQCRADYTNDAGNPASVMMIMGWDANEGCYVSWRFYGSGFRDVGRGWVDGDTWTILYDEPIGRRYRFIGVAESDTVWSYRWERSELGGPWVETSGDTMTRVR